MKLYVFLAACIAVSFAAPQSNPKDAEIISYVSDNIGVDGYNFAYETSDGVSRHEKAVLKNAGTENEAIYITGSYSWTGPDNQRYTVDFEADENGYRATGAHIPKA